MPEVPNIVRVTIEADPDTENPAEADGAWTVYTFGRDHVITDCSRDRFYDEDGNPNDEDLARKLSVGLAFGVRYSEHGLCRYDLAHDTSDGLIVWEHPDDEIGGKTIEERRKDAESFLSEYTEWANGNCHWYRVERITSVAPEFDPEDGDLNGAFWTEVSSCGGFIGDYIVEAVAEEIARFPGARVIVEGDGAWIADQLEREGAS